MGLKTYRLPPPTSEQNKSERRYKKVIGIVKHNEPVDLTHIGLRYYRNYSRRKHKLKPVVKQAMQNGHIRRAKDGFVVTDEVD